MKASGILTITLLFASMLFMSGCISQLSGSGEKTTTLAATQATQPELVCNPPYIVYGGDCCLDRNQNNVCDSIETTQPTTQPSTTRQQTTLATTTTTLAAANQGQTTTTLKQQCNQGYFDNDPACGQACPARQSCVKSGITIQYAGQSISCYYCKEVCPTDDPENKYYYDDPACGGACNITGGWYCFQSVLHQGCYLCQRPCPANYYYKDGKCGDKCASGTQCTKSTQLPDCYWCKSPCPEGYYYKDAECGSDCMINEYCKESYEDCYLCVEGEEGCTRGYYYKDNTCNDTCDSEEGEICGTLMGTQNCYYCRGITTTIASATTTTVAQCGGDLYSSSNCDGRCDSKCEQCLQYQGWPCYICENKPCSQISETYPLYGSSSDCARNCSQNVGQCRPYSDCTHCYYCYLYECGNGDVEPGEQCEDDSDCPDYHNCNANCECVTNCAGYCANQGYPYIQGIGSKADCEDKLTADMNALRNAGTCRAVCGAYAWMEGMSADCCCVDTDWKPCLNCPNQNPALIDCQTPLAQCTAGL